MAATDPLLVPYLNAATESDATELLGQLLTSHATPLIRQTVAGTLRPGAASSGSDRQDLDDVCAEVLLRLVTRLQALRRDGDGEALASFRSYVAVSAYHATYEHLRSRRPGRWRLKNRLRYLLSHQDGLMVWEAADRRWLCSLARARKGAPGMTRSLVDVRAALEQAAPAAGEKFADAVRTVLDAAGGPVSLDDLVTLVSERCGIETEIAAAPPSTEAGERALDDIVDPRASVALELDQRRYVRAMWQEVLELPVRQRTALLLNLRDEAGRSAIGLLPITGVASVRRIATALELADHELAALWPRLPLDDEAVALRLGLKRQQVINLRKAARERLARRLKGREFPLSD